MKILPLSAPHKGLFRFTAFLFTLGLVSGLSACGGGSSSDRPELNISLPTVTEGDSGNVELVFTVTLSEDAEETLTADFTTTDGTATVADNDYTAVNGSITIPEGSRTATVSVFAKGDDDFELDETFNLVVSNVQGVRLDESSYSVQGLIENDDDAEPVGFYTGTATVNSTALIDVKGMMYNNRLLMFSPMANVLYDITFSDITVNDFTATAEVYANGDINDAASHSNVSLSGTTDEATITGVFSGGSGLANGRFQLVFDEDNNKEATLARIETFGSNGWVGDFISVDTVIGEIGFNSLGGFGGTTQLPICEFSNGITIQPTESISTYLLEHITNQILNCANPGIDYTGFGVVTDGEGTDTVLYFATTNGEYAVFAELSRDPNQ